MSINLTPQRKAILDVIRSAHDHPTASDIIARLNEHGLHFAYGTVYNSLRYLTEMNLIRELKLGDSASRYDGNTEEHHHVQCTICGKVDEVTTHPPLDWTSQIEQDTDYAIQTTQIIFKGVCPSCRQGQSPSKP
ncbi:transcriptional repressor [Pullulanibacillus sp. KACC 23026]|uniref:Fur family transcriptional regulator n=1 Tax=Pullulanibacillus sp. KACC 23026 TaxID=3028315 RepID=UPI0023B01F99|nr:transcriptional repressor [Pullulanibacillus sp. KACC 23026]WEG13003.1 transcriptional repressor [Pullulanibacillus sp. KACC 23026]